VLRKRSKVAAQLDAWQRKQDRRIQRERVKRAEKDQARIEWEAKREAVYKREGGRCRATGVPLRLHDRNPFRVMHVHHKVPRSAQGSDDLSNLVGLAPEVHVMEHDGLLEIRGDDCNQTLVFTFLDAYGKILRIQESPCPAATD
jgi:5-methylcytosine-specific restriction endonuclease McrA